MCALAFPAANAFANGALQREADAVRPNRLVTPYVLAGLSDILRPNHRADVDDVAVPCESSGRG
jgi:hypothetical protein